MKLNILLISYSNPIFNIVSVSSNIKLSKLSKFINSFPNNSYNLPGVPINISLLPFN